MISRRIIIALFFLSVLYTVPHFWSLLRGDRTSVVAKHDTGQELGKYFNGLALEARAAYVYDVREKRALYEKNEELPFPLASLTKVMTALVALESAPEGTHVTIKPETLTPEGDSGLRVGEDWRLRDLVDFTLTTSSNDGARALASLGQLFVTQSAPTPEEAFIARMNAKARELGLRQTYFLNESGLDVNEGLAGAYGSAKDIGQLFAYILSSQPELFEATGESKINALSSDGVHTAPNTNIIVERIPGIIASKTGFTDLAGGNLAVAYDAGPLRPIAIVVLGSSVEGRFSDVEKLVFASLGAIQEGAL